MDLSKKQKLVLEVIQQDPRAADDDALLIARVWAKEGFGHFYNSQGLYLAIKHMTRPETITRRRRELHNLGLIKYADKAEKDRTEAYIAERDHASGSKWGGIRL